MFKDAFPLNNTLVNSTRLSSLTQWSGRLNEVRGMEIALLVSMGITAGVCTSLFNFGLRMPGHAILRSIPLIALGLAMVPRRNGGWLLGIGAAFGVSSVRLCGGPLPGMGASTSLLLVGPLLEFALRRATGDWRIYLSFALAGLAANCVALVVRAAPKVLGLESGFSKPLGPWLTSAAFSYAMCGLLAGLISAWICFRAGERDSSTTGEASL